MTTQWMVIGATVLAGLFDTPDAARTRWTYKTNESDRAAPVIAGNLDGLTGDEVLVFRPGSGELTMLNDEGVERWSHAWKSAPSASAIVPGAAPTIALVANDGALALIGGDAGQPVWESALPAAEPASMIVTPLERDGPPAIVCAQPSGGLEVYRAESGEPVWSASWSQDGADANAPPALAAYDVDHDGDTEIIVLSPGGLIVFNADGEERFAARGDAPFIGEPLVADANDDGFAEIYARTKSPAALVSYDADFGDERWRAPLSGGDDDDVAGDIGIGDLDADTIAELVVHHGDGLHWFSASGDAIASFRCSASAGDLTVGDINGSGTFDFIVTTRDGFAIVDIRGGIWHQANDRFVAPVRSVDGLAGIVVQAPNGDFEWRTWSAQWRDALMPWPGARGPLDTNAYVRPPLELDVAWVLEQTPLLPEGDFEQADADDAALPAGWRPGDGADVALDTVQARVGEASLRVSASNAPVVVRSISTPIPLSLESVLGAFEALGDGASGAALRWHGPEGILRADEFRRVGAIDSSWQRFVLDEVRPPLGAQRYSVLLRTQASDEPTHFDALTLTGSLKRVPRIRVVCNQVGFDGGAPKKFTVITNFPPSHGKLRVTGAGGQFRGHLDLAESTTIVEQPDWGAYFMRGSFDSFTEPGTYTITVTVDETTAQGPQFEIDDGVLWPKTLRAVWAAIERFRAPKATGGGWHDGMTETTANSAYYFWELTRNYWSVRNLLGVNDDVIRRRMLDELAWGADYSVWSLTPTGAAMESGPSDRARGADDSLYHAAGLARYARTLEDNARFVEAAARAYNHATTVYPADDERDRMIEFSAAVDLWRLTDEERYLNDAQARYNAGSRFCLDAIVDYGNDFDPAFSFAIAETARTYCEKRIQRAKNPFGIAAFDDGTGGVLLKHHGNNAHVLEEAAAVARLYRFMPEPEHLAFIVAQIDWVLGNNPFGVCMMQGFGESAAPRAPLDGLSNTQAGRTFAGAILNGIAVNDANEPTIDLRDDGDLDLRTNGVSLRNLVAYTSALMQWKRVPTGSPIGG